MTEIDLHIHTTASDGTCTPREAVRRAASLGLRAIAITDHDTVFGHAEAFSAAMDYGIEVVPGIEVSTKYGVSVHILGYYIENLIPLLANVVKERTGAKVRGIELSLLQRCGAHLASQTDIEESFMAGKAAVENAVAGITDKMVAFERATENGHYVCKTKLLNLTDVANYEKKVPLEWINDAHNGIKHEFVDYALPLIQGETQMVKVDSLPRFAKLKKVLAE